MKTEDIVRIKQNNTNPYRIEQRLYDELENVIDSYSGLTSLVATLGVLDLLKDKLIRENKE